MLDKRKNILGRALRRIKAKLQRPAKNRKYVFDRALKWIKVNTVDAKSGIGKGIAVTQRRHIIYPEVTGYYIPSLLEWGEKELALEYAKYLISAQQADGSWLDSEEKDPYVFDTAQILKGLIAIREIMPEADNAIIRGTDWIISNMKPNGRLTTPSIDAWGSDDSVCSELIHVYCLSPLKEAGKIFNRQDYSDAAVKILDYYKTNYMDRIKNFSLLSHFYAYVMEGLYDMGETDLCRESMERLSNYQYWGGGLPGLKNVHWICSTGMFQTALVWYKLGELKKGDKLFYYACSLQNKSGGWFGSYPASILGRIIPMRRFRPYYFRTGEISWANKFFLDALAQKVRLNFNEQASHFLEHIDEDDGRYQAVESQLLDVMSSVKITRGGGGLRVADIGCGKGRYLVKLRKRFPDNHYCAVDLSSDVLKNVEADKKLCGRMTNLPFQDNSLDFVYACESYEHSINMRGAFRELYRIIKPGGRFMIVDKPIEKLGRLNLYEWEAWISDDDIRCWSEECGGTLTIIPSLEYGNGKNDGLFRAWIVRKK